MITRNGNISGPEEWVMMVEKHIKPLKDSPLSICKQAKGLELWTNIKIEVKVARFSSLAFYSHTATTNEGKEMPNLSRRKIVF